MLITKSYLKILKYLYRNNNISYLKISKRFKKPNMEEMLYSLVLNRYVIQIGGSVNDYGEPIEITDQTTFKLDELGISEVEKHQWWNFQFFLTQILLPIVIGVISTLITICLSVLL